jgi:hypothetical protein
LAGFFSTSHVDRIWDSGVTFTPSVGAEWRTTPTAPYPRSSRSWVIVPPAEWPMRTGGVSSAPITSAMESTICGRVTSAIGVGSALSASTSTSKPG